MIQAQDHLTAELHRLEAELRTHAVLRDNFHDLYRQERDARIAAERVLDARTAERDRLEAEVQMLHSQLHSLREQLARSQGRTSTPAWVDLRGEPHPDWTPRVLESR